MLFFCRLINTFLQTLQRTWEICICDVGTRDQPKFFDQVGRQTTSAHLLEKSIFSLNLVKLNKIMNNLVKDLKVIFKCLKLVESFQKKIFEEYLIRRPTYQGSTEGRFLILGRTY